MRVFLADPEEILVAFVDAQRATVVKAPTPEDGFIWPQRGKSGLSAPRNRSPDEQRVARSERTVRYEQKRCAEDADYAERQRVRKNERVRAWRLRQKAKRGAAPVRCDHCAREFTTRKSLGQHRAWLSRGGR